MYWVIPIRVAQAVQPVTLPIRFALVCPGSQVRICAQSSCPVTADGVCNGNGTCINGSCRQSFEGEVVCVIDSTIIMPVLGCGCQLHFRGYVAHPEKVKSAGDKGFCYPEYHQYSTELRVPELPKWILGKVLRNHTVCSSQL